MSPSKFYTKEEALTIPPKTILKHLLSGAYSLRISDSSDFDHVRHKQIGKGQCGTIYTLQDTCCPDSESLNTTSVLKLANSSKDNELKNDHEKHLAVLKAFTKMPEEFRVQIDVPRVQVNFIEPDSEWFWDLKSWGYGIEPGCGIFCSRIFPVPLAARAALVDLYAPSEIQKIKGNFLDDRPQQKDCLIRVYLGRRLSKKEKRPLSSLENFTLRNFPLHVNEMEELGLDTHHCARIMAHTLATLHWTAKIDANDIEFFLGTTASSSSSIISEDGGDQEIGMWILDFNQCSTFEDGDGGIKSLVDGLYWNDPYYPRPDLKENKEDAALWKTFKVAYLKASKTLMGESRLPYKFMAVVEEEGEKRGCSAVKNLFGL